MTKGQARFPHESQAGYRKRLKAEKLLIRGYLRGRRIWNSLKYGAYSRDKHGEIGSNVGKGEGIGVRRCN